MLWTQNLTTVQHTGHTDTAADYSAYQQTATSHRWTNEGTDMTAAKYNSVIVGLQLNQIANLGEWAI